MSFAAALPAIRSEGGLSRYLTEIHKFPLLSASEEATYAQRWRDDGDRDAAYQLVTSHLRLAAKIALQYKRYGLPIADLISEANVGLMLAIKRFDPERGCRLATYAAWWIKASVQEYILRSWSLVKLGTTQAQRKLFFNLNKERARLKAMGIEPTTTVLADRIGVSENEVVDMDKRLKGDDVSLNAELFDGEGRPLTRMDMLPDPRGLQDELFMEAHFDDALSDHLEEYGKTLVGKEAFIFRKRLMSSDPMTLQEIGDEFTVSRERIRQVEKRLLTKLRTYLTAGMPEYFEEDEE